MTNEPSPRPWHIGESISGTMSCIFDANGEHIASCFGAPTEADAALIVAAVNKYGMPIVELIKAYGALEAERDRLRDIVRRLVNQFGNLTSYDDDAAILREARAALGEGETPTGKGVGR